MKDIFGVIGKILSFIFAALVIGFTSLLTWLLAQRIIPGDTVLDIVLQVMVLILFDGAALVWFVTFLTVARGTIQWALSGLGFAVGLLGAIIMAGGELVLGQELVAIDDPTRLSWVLISTVVVAALVHAVLIYLFHFSDPVTRNRIENAQKVSKAIDKAYSDAAGEIDRQVDELTARLVDSVIDEARQQINAATALHIRRAAQIEAQANGTMIDGGELRDPAPRPARVRKPARKGWKDFMSALRGSEAQPPENGADPTQPPKP